MKRKKGTLTALFALFIVAMGWSQEVKKKIDLGGEIVTELITEEGDTILIADLDDVSVSSLRTFKNRHEEYLYKKYRRYAVKVYPFAVDAIRIFRQTGEVTRTMKKSKRKQHMRRLNRELKKEFKNPLKKLTKTQGRILIRMIEKELDTPMYTLLKELRGGASARYWQTLGKFNGYDLKRGYVVGDDHILDAVLNDFDISYEL